MGRISIVDRFACALGDHYWRPSRRIGGMECQWCGRERPLSDCRYDEAGRWRWTCDTKEEAA